MSSQKNRRRLSAKLFLMLATFMAAMSISLTVAPVPVLAQGSSIDCKSPTVTSSNCGIVGYLVRFINILSAVVGVVVVIMVAVGGVQYTMSKDDPQATAEAKRRIRNALLALVFYVFTFAFLQWLVPGGIF